MEKDEKEPSVYSNTESRTRRLSGSKAQIFRTHTQIVRFDKSPHADSASNSKEQDSDYQLD